MQRIAIVYISVHHKNTEAVVRHIAPLLPADVFDLSALHTAISLTSPFQPDTDVILKKERSKYMRKFLLFMLPVLLLCAACAKQEAPLSFDDFGIYEDGKPSANGYEQGKMPFGAPTEKGAFLQQVYVCYLGRGYETARGIRVGDSLMQLLRQYEGIRGMVYLQEQGMPSQQMQETGQWRSMEEISDWQASQKTEKEYCISFFYVLYAGKAYPAEEFQKAFPEGAESLQDFRPYCLTFTISPAEHDRITFIKLNTWEYTRA